MMIYGNFIQYLRLIVKKLARKARNIIFIHKYTINNVNG